ncbi:hypothetical protein [Radiobacillus sp. PE A8.2]|uniref:hypothetical protein n=1 Tax=Radiobacillus sp. PE A8.2 TaxID=3380349 RepID=UPI00388D83F4
MPNSRDKILKKIKPPDPSITKELDIVIDLLTPCLEHSKTGEIYATEFQEVTHSDLREINPRHGWNDFNWELYLDEPHCKVVKLMVKGDPQIQGLISYELKEGWVEVHLVESAPWNVKGKQFIGVGPHLFAIACKASFELGFDGYVSFVAKTGLLNHYVETLQATVLNVKTRQLVIETEAAKVLISTYF